MRSTETSEHEAPQITYEEAMDTKVIPNVRIGPAIVENRGPVGMGWLRDLPDFRDYTSESAAIAPQLETIGVTKPQALTLATQVDLRPYCSPIENQGALGSCTANAVIGLVEYFERRAHGKFIDASRLFLYKVTRDLLHWTGDTGAYLRSTMGALALFGVPPEEYCPYDVTAFDSEPSALCFAFASNFRAISYYRLDPAGTSPSALLARIKANLSAGLPSVFGFTVYSSIAQSGATGRIAYPSTGDKVVGGHAMLTVGYDDNVKITNANTMSSTKGAFIVRNSWGPAWGDNGYGMLPYDYVTNRLAVDFWSLTNQDWTDTGAFKA
jgi:C1A family cysteine protease